MKQVDREQFMKFTSTLTEMPTIKYWNNVSTIENQIAIQWYKIDLNFGNVKMIASCLIREDNKNAYFIEENNRSSIRGICIKCKEKTVSKGEEYCDGCK